MNMTRNHTSSLENHLISSRELSLSSTQQVVWLDQILHPDTPNYNISTLVCIEGELDEVLFIQALESVVSRHDALRLRLVDTHGLPRQKLVDTLPVSLSIHDFSQYPDAETQVTQQTYATFIRPFHLYGELWRSELLRVSETRWYWQFCCHHLISDGLGLRLVIKDLADNYNRLVKGEALAEAAPSYLDFIVEDRAYLDSKLYTRDLQFWLERYKKLPPALIPPSNLSTSVTHEQAKPILWQLDKTLFQQIENTVAAHGLSVLHFMYAVLACYFARSTDVEEIVIGTPVHNRRNAKQKGTMGMFSSVIPIGVTVHSEDSFLDVMRKAAMELRRCYKHQRLPIAEINQHTQIKQKTGRTQLFDIILSLELFKADMNMQGTVTTLKQSHRGAMFPLSIAIYQYTFTHLENISHPATIEFNYDTNYLNHEEVVALQSRLALLVETAITSLDMPIGNAPLLPTAERQKLLVDFNATGVDFPQDTLIQQLFEQQAERTPDATAMVFETHSLSYDELNRRANQLAHHLLTIGVQPDDRVAICVERSLEMIVGLLAILKAGGAYVPLDPAYPTERLTYMLDDAAPIALLTQSSLIERLNSHLPTVILDAQAPSVFDEDSEENPNAQALGITSHHLAYVIYTSGSTGQPKGVMVTHRNVINLYTGLNAALDLQQPCRIAMNASIVFDASVQSWFQLLSGHTLIIVPEEIRADGQQLWRYFAHHLVDMFDCTPVQLQWLLDAGLGTRAGYQPKLALIGGDTIPPLMWSRLQEIETTRFINVYGPTECTVDATLCPVDVSLSQPSIGRPIANTQIYILDKQGRLLPFGAVGEIYIGGVGVSRGYLNRPVLTTERFIPDPFSTVPDARLYKTGDLGRWLPDGNIEYLGRNDFQIKLRGFRVELGEIEARLVQCPEIDEAVVIAREDIPGDKRLVAYLRTQPDSELIPAKLRQQLAQHLADYMLPSAFVVLENFPLTPNGKLDRKALPIPDQSAVITRNYEAPSGELEIILAEIWQDLLGLVRVGRHDHFFELGGHSLIAVSLIEQLRSAGWLLDVRHVFSSPVLADMAQAIQTNQNDSAFIVPPNCILEGCTTLTPEMLPLVTLSQAEIDIIAKTVIGGAANVQDIYPLAPLQEGILFHHQLQEQGDTYLLNSLIAFDNREYLNAFLEALQKVIDRHDILRTAICWQDVSRPVQVVWRQAPLSVATFEPTSVDNVQAQLQAHTDPRQRRLDLSQAPLLTADIAHDPVKQEWLLALNYHHLVCDHMTLELIVDEIRLLLQGRTDELPNPLPYRNFIAQTLNVPASVHEDYFRARLADVDTPTAPFGLFNVQSDCEDIVETRLLLDRALAGALRAQARHLGISAGVLFHVAWAQVLAKTSGRDDVVFGSVLLGRLQGSAGADRVMGMFINTLPIRISLANRSVLEVVQATYRDLTSLLEHEQAPLALAQRCSGVAPSLPLFNSLLNYRHSKSDSIGVAWDGIRVLTTVERNNYPLTLSIDDIGEDFGLVVQSIAEIDPARITGYLTTVIVNLLNMLTTDPHQPICHLSILPDHERQQLLMDFSATKTEFPQNVLVHQLFEQQVERTPDAIAMVFEGYTFSYEELNRRANCLAHHLLTLGVKPDDRVAICVKRSPEMIVGLLAILKAGGAYIPLDPSYPVERLTYMLNDAAPVVLLTQTILKEKLGSNLPTVVLDAQKTSVFDKKSAENPDAQALGLTSHNLAYVIYTSGSTGQPKGVMVEHGGFRNYLQWALGHYASAGQLNSIVSSPVAFDATVTSIYLPLLCGGKIQLLRDGQELTELIPALLSMDTAALVKITPTHFATVGQELLATKQTCPAHYFIVGGEPLPGSTVARWRELSPESRIVNEYGPTETVVGCITFDTNKLSNITGNVPIGCPIANTQIYILDTQREPVPLGVIGEIYIGGAGVARGYLNQPELTAERFVPNPFSDIPHARMYKTGDLGRWRPDGNIEYLGRNDFQVKVRGFRIELGEIETQLVQCPGVDEAVVVAREDMPGDTRLVAYLRPQSGVEPVLAELHQQLTRHLAEYMIPSAFVMLETFPLTPNGKLDRKALPTPDQSAVATHAYEAPIGKLEITLAQIWQELLGLERVGRYDHFFKLGGHSLLAVQCTTRVRQVLALDLPLAQFFAQPVLIDLARTLTDTSVSTQTMIPAVDRSLPLPLSFTQQRLWFLDQLDPAASRAYHISAVLQLSGKLNYQAMTSALDSLVDRQESLRTRFILVDGQPCQEIAPSDIGFTLSYLDMRHLSEIDRTNRVAELAECEARMPFDLTQGPLVRGQLLQLADEEHVLLFTQHHIISDGWSIGIMVRELAAFYQAALNDHDVALPPLPIQYADYAVWQRNELQQDVLSEQQDFWYTQLQGAPALLELPTDRPRLPLQSYAGKQIPIHLNTEVLASLRIFSQGQDTTLFMSLLAAWAIVLARLSGQDDIVIGTPVANRQNRESEELIGFFVNTLALRIESGQCNTVEELLAQVRKRTIAAYAHQALPFEQVVEALQPDRSLSYNPIFQVMLVLNNTPAQALKLPGLELTLLEQPRLSTQFDLTLSLTETDVGLVGGLEYATDLFDQETVIRIAGYFENVLTAMVTDATQAISSLPMLSVAERQQLLVDFNATQADFPQEALIHELFEQQVERTPEATAVEFEGQSLSYRELNRRANQLAHHLLALGVQPDDRVAICTERSLE
uniref:amino acid adenylation domain-containing protein n=1 Tax=Xenorhabdus indica TaxID=333964 RepID=UPI001656C38C